MNTLVLDLQNLVSNHLTTIEDVFIYYHDHGKIRKMRKVVASGDWKDMMYYFQRYEYQTRLLNDVFQIAKWNHNTKLKDLLVTRYNLNIANMTPISQSKVLYSSYANIIHNLKTNWGIRHRDVKLLINNCGYIPPIIRRVSNEKSFEIVSKNIIDYFTNTDNRDYNTMRFWAAILALSNKGDALRDFIKFQSIITSNVIPGEEFVEEHLKLHDVAMYKLIISALIRTDNLNLFIEIFNLSKLSLDGFLGIIFYNGAFRILKYLIDTCNLKTYTDPMTIVEIRDPRIARMLVACEGFEIKGLDGVIADCKLLHYDVVAKILSTLN